MAMYWARFFEENGGGFSVDVPDLPGCFTEGDTLEEAYRYLVEEAMPLWLEGQAEPVASGLDAVAAAPAPDGAPRPILIQAAPQPDAEAMARFLASAAASRPLAQAARAYLARL